jgi:deoxyadenosine/deoxycytidine kinase
MVGQRSRPPKIRRVEIAGGIASGKTTLARLLATAGLTPVHEQFRKNPFFEAFYRDPTGTAFETEITFLLQHYHLQKEAISRKRSFCTDFSLLLDHAYAHVTMRPRDKAIFKRILQRAERELIPRSLVIVLICSPDIELHRIRCRRRAAENSISRKYLANLNRALQNRVGALGREANVLEVDSGTIDFARSSRGKELVVQQVLASLRGK